MLAPCGASSTLCELHVEPWSAPVEPARDPRRTPVTESASRPRSCRNGSGAPPPRDTRAARAPARRRRDEHQQRRPRQVEIGEQAADHTEPKPGRMKMRRRSGAPGPNRPVRRAPAALERARRRRPDRDDPPPFGERRVSAGRGLGTDFGTPPGPPRAPRRGRAHRFECAVPDVQGDPTRSTPRAASASSSARREVQPGRGRRHRPALPREHRLIALSVPRRVVALDVRRQRACARSRRSRLDRSPRSTTSRTSAGRTCGVPGSRRRRRPPGPSHTNRSPTRSF